MDNFSLYPREEPFDPFAVMLFKGLQVIAFLFFLALLAINPEAKTGKIDTNAEFIIAMNWPDNHPDDIDLYVEDPVGNIVWFHQREAGFMVLERDDRGGANDFIMVNGKKITTPLREEIVSIRGHLPGEYTVNVQHYLSTTRAPVQVSVKVEKINPTLQVVHYDTLTLSQTGQEKTAVRFRVANDGAISDVSSRQKSLVELTRSTKRGATAGGGAK